MKYIGHMLFLMLGMVLTTRAVPPVINYAGQVAVNGEAFDGNGLFKFALVNTDSMTTYWSNDGTSKRGSEPKASVSVPVNGGLYSILLGNTALKGMGAIDPAVFVQNSNTKLRVWFSDGVNGFERLKPDQPFASVPYAFSAVTAKNAETAKTADSANIANTAMAVQEGAITNKMLGDEVLNNINATIGMNRLTSEVKEKLNQEKTTTNYEAPVAGSLIAVPYGSSAPTGYSLFQRGEQKKLVWEEKAPVKKARPAYDGVEVLNGKIYFVGDSSDTGKNNTIERYDPETDSWDNLNSANNARAGVACAVLDGKIYAIGGIGLSSVEVYDPDLDSWTFTTPLPGVVGRGSAVTFKNKIYLFGGHNENGTDLNQVLVFDNTSKKWSQVSSMPSALSSFKAITYEERIWLIGGSNNLGNHQNNISRNYVRSYDVENNTWHSEAALPQARAWPSAWSLNSSLIVAGGAFNNKGFNDIFEYDPNKKTWNSIGHLTDNSYAAGSVVFDSSLFLISGLTDDSISAKQNKVFVSMLSKDMYDLYRKDGDAPVGTTVVQLEYADGSVTTSKLDATILKYLKPEITRTPEIPDLILGGQTVTLQSQAKGKYLTYQWYKNGQPITGATGENYVIDNANKSLHDGNYSVVVSNDFGTITTQAISLEVENTLTVASAGIEMIWVNPGSFTMKGNGNNSMMPEHNVTLSSGFYLGKYEVTQKQYYDVMFGNEEGLNPNPSLHKGSSRPVELVSWLDVQVFLHRLNEIEKSKGRLPLGLKFSLPTEAEWELACRAGTNTAYSWGNDINSSQANYNWDGGSLDGNDFKQTRDVGQYEANPWGFFDMHGNVWEWTSDTYMASIWSDQNFSTIDPEGLVPDPFLKISGNNIFNLKVKRGGSWLKSIVEASSSYRTGHYGHLKSSDLGFRVSLKFTKPDIESPKIFLSDPNDINVSAGMSLVKSRIEAHDVRDGNITDKIVVTGSVDMNRTGEYTLTYTVMDAAGNKDTKTHTVTVRGNHTVDLNATVAMDMIWCPPGTFTMGSPTDEAGRGNDENQTQVMLNKGFYLGKYEVTQTQYEAVMTGNAKSLSASPSNWPNNPNRPVEEVSWDDTQVFLTRLNEQQKDNLPAGWSYVLPTESQWEYACRAGTNTIYYWGNEINATHANYLDSGLSQTRNVGQYSPNPWGFFDMLGNVWEWTADWYNATYPTGNPVIDPTGPALASYRVRRGGSWLHEGTILRSARRSSNSPEYRRSFLGFRVSLQKSQ